MSRLKTHVAAVLAAGRLPWAGWVTSLVWLLVAGSAVHWGLALLVRGRDLPSQVQTVGVEQALQGDAQRLFARPTVAVAAMPAASPARDRFRVIGGMGGDDGGLALMAVDGKPVRAYRVGAAVDAQWVVQAVSQRAIQIGPAGQAAVLSLDLPVLPAAATGRLSSQSLDAPSLTRPNAVMSSAGRAPAVPNGPADGVPANALPMVNEGLPEAPVAR